MTTVSNRTRGTTLAAEAEVARGPWRSFVGLMGRAGLPAGAGLVFLHTRGVHTHFMRFPIDVVFYDRNGVVVAISHALRPWRFSRYHLRASGAVELPAGAARASETRVGDSLEIAVRGLHQTATVSGSNESPLAASE